MPWVASEACWRKTVVLVLLLSAVDVGTGIWQMSMGIERR